MLCKRVVELSIQQLKATGMNTPLIIKYEEDQQFASYAIKQMVELSRSQVKFGYIFSSFNNQDDSPLLDSYQKTIT